MNTPLFKKDLVYRRCFAAWEINSWANDVLSDAEKKEYMKIISKKGNSFALTGLDKLKYLVGEK